MVWEVGELPDGRDVLMLSSGKLVEYVRVVAQVVEENRRPKRKVSVTEVDVEGLI